MDAGHRPWRGAIGRWHTGQSLVIVFVTVVHRSLLIHVCGRWTPATDKHLYPWSVSPPTTFAMDRSLPLIHLVFLIDFWIVEVFVEFFTVQIFLCNGDIDQLDLYLLEFIPQAFCFHQDIRVSLAHNTVL